MYKKLLLPIVLLLSPVDSFANSNLPERNITFTINESIKVKADASRLNFQVSTLAKNNKEALANNNKKSNLIRGVLKNEKIASKDIDSGNLYTYIEYDYSVPNVSKIKGYRATQSFTIIIRNIESSGDLVDKIVAAAGDNVAITGITPFLVNEKSEYKKLRKLAANSAKEVANEYAENFDVKLEKLFSIIENSSQVPTYPIYRNEVASVNDSSTKFDFAEIDLSISITVSYIIK
jgi:uncharacterized protein YggE